MSAGPDMQKWSALRDDWGSRLLTRFPGGLGSMPDFHSDSGKRTIWLAEGFTEYVKQDAALNSMPLTLACGEHYPDFRNLTRDQEIEIAEKTFEDACLLWNLAKEASRVRDVEDRARAVEQVADDQLVDNYIRRLAALKTVAELNFERDNVSGRLAETKLQKDVRDTNIQRRLLLAVQDRIIAIERERAADERVKATRDRRFGWAGVVFGVIGIVTAFAIAHWPHFFEATTPECAAPNSTQTSAPLSPTSPNPK